MPRQYSDKVRLLRKLHEVDGCWEWTGSRDRKRYGYFRFRHTVWKVHRVAWTLFIGEIPDETWVLHHCDNPPCFNPDHLFLGTVKDNIQDMDRKKRRYVANKPNYNAKLTVAQVLEIRASYVKGRPFHGGNAHELAERFNVTQSAISSIVLRDLWKWC